MRRLLISSIGFVLVFALSARADVITIEPDDFAVGTDLTHVGPGVTLWRATASASADTPIELSRVHSTLDPAFATTGSQLFGAFSGSQNFSRCFEQVHGVGYPREAGNQCQSEAGHSALLLEFAEGADFVEIGATWASDFLVMFGYDASFNRVSWTGLSGPGGTTTPTGGRYHRTIQSMSSTTPLRYVLLGSTEGRINLDQLRYEAVPEPTTLMLVGVGLGIFAARRRRAR